MDGQHLVHRDDRGATATEYALLIAGIAMMVVGLIVLFGESLAANWETFADLL